MQNVPEYNGLDESLNSGLYWDQDVMILKKGKRTFEGAKNRRSSKCKDPPLCQYTREIL
jgi:hypothetical protein